MSSLDQNLKRNYDRKGFGLGTAILSASQLKEVHTLISQAFGRLKDPTIGFLQQALEDRLTMAGIEVGNLVPLRAFANRSIITARPSSHDKEKLIHPDQLAKVEQAILQQRAVLLKIPDPKKPGETTEVRVWPLQILFHNIAWYLAYESTELGALLTVIRLDRVKLALADVGQQRSLAEMQKAQARLEHLCRRTGGIFLGDNHTQQGELGVQILKESKINELLERGTLTRVRFRCSARIYTFIREANNRYPEEQIRLSGPLPSDEWTISSPKLEPDPQDATHPYPVELILPTWTIDSNDFKGWLFGFGDGVKIESPEVLRDKHRTYGEGIAALYSSSANEA